MNYSIPDNSDFTEDFLSYLRREGLIEACAPISYTPISLPLHQEDTNFIFTATEELGWAI
jgi:hypothetical protein